MASPAGAEPLAREAAFPASLVLTPVSRWPTRLPDATVATVLAQQPPRGGAAADAGAPVASVLVVALNNLVFTRLCLESVLANTASPRYEIVVVDNGSTDETPAYLRELAAAHGRVRVITNARNLGFAPAVNQAMAAATGEFFVLLNNDTVVPPGWLAGLLRPLQEKAAALVGPVTNRAADESQIEASYRTYGELLDFARAHAAAHAGDLVETSRMVMFCAAMRREVYDRLGPFDEQFAVAMFEDDDYVLRARRAGYRVARAEDVFVHHFGQASIGHLGPAREYGALFERNRRRFEEKWSTVWQAHRSRPRASYEQLKDRLRAAVESALPPGATVLVVSKGDETLLDLPHLHASHFPQIEGGTYAGHHPASSAEAIAELERLRGQGAGFLILPAPALWWLDHYEDFRRHLERRGRVLLDERETCLIFAL